MSIKAAPGRPLSRPSSNAVFLWKSWSRSWGWRSRKNGCGLSRRVSLTFRGICLPLRRLALSCRCMAGKKGWSVTSSCRDLLIFPYRTLALAVGESLLLPHRTSGGEIKSIFAHGPFPVMLAHKHFLACTSYENCTTCTEA